MKHLVPVKIIAISYSLQASITSLSRIDPPGCNTVLIPESFIASILSRNGKKASEAKTPPSTPFRSFRRDDDDSGSSSGDPRRGARGRIHHAQSTLADNLTGLHCQKQAESLNTGAIPRGETAQSVRSCEL